ncbi:MAG: hypothetical protein ACH37Z_02200 [Anaerolineae bacterium]
MSGRPVYYGYNDFSSRTGGLWTRNSVVGKQQGEFEEIVDEIDSNGAMEVAVIYDTKGSLHRPEDTGVVVDHIKITLFEKGSVCPVPTGAPEVSMDMSSVYFPILRTNVVNPHGDASQTPPPGQPYLAIENVQFQRTDSPIVATLRIMNRSTTTSYVSRALTVESRHADWKCIAEDFVLASGQRSTISFEGNAVSWQNERFHCSGLTSLDPKFDEIQIRDEDGRYLYGYCWDLDGAFPCGPGDVIQ